ncbi:MAG: M23 family metallopeptidase [Lachnospiraceae bacterium]|nr:M23 family metallopeptidase [Lachnospiraceae bacterium]
MKKITKHYKRLRFTYMKLAGGILFIAALFFPAYVKWEDPAENIFTVYLNGESVGVVGDTARAEVLLQETRRELVQDTDELVLIDVDMNLEGQAVLWGRIDDEELLKERMRQILRNNIKETMQRSFVVKVNNYMVNLGSREEVEQLLQAAVDKYDSEGIYQVELVHAEGREFNVLTARVHDIREDEEAEALEANALPSMVGGIDGVFAEAFEEAEPIFEMDFEDYEQGLVSMDFAEEVEIVEAYLDESQLTPLDQAMEEVIKEQEVNSVYEVVSGDTLSGIAIKVDIPMERLVEMNDSLETINSTIRVGQELIITIPEPELSLDRQEQLYLKEIYDADIIYKDNDNWYTYQTKTLQEPSAGFRKVIAVVSYRNDKEVGREIIKEEIVMEAVPKIVERGTIVPPTYIRPVSGGRQTSGFGRRKAPTAGASTYHKGVDWAVPTGTAVVASSGGTVVKAGWGSGYGYVVYIQHDDGRQTRYAHLSRVLVSSGQRVSQGERIGLSGSTGVATGPHLHFEMLINNTQVNPLNYLEN